MQMPNIAPPVATVRQLGLPGMKWSQQLFSANWQGSHFGALVAEKSTSQALHIAFHAGFPLMTT